MSKATAEKPQEFFTPSPAIVKRAREYMARYTFIMEPMRDGHGYMGWTAELPGVIAGGDTRAECTRRVEFATETVIATYLVDGEEPPPPVKPGLSIPQLDDDEKNRSDR